MLEADRRRHSKAIIRSTLNPFAIGAVLYVPVSESDTQTGVATSQRVHWVHLHPQGGEKKFSGLIYRENDCVSALPSQSKSQF